MKRLKSTDKSRGKKRIQNIETCPFCHSKGRRRHRGLFYCRKCDMAMNADSMGVLNMARGDGAIIPSPSCGRDNGLVAQPLLLRWDGTK
ncbi:MAG: hypothetical protein ACP5KV_02590 [Candidatus Methanomethylicaceae archaeon]